ncbi:Beta-ketoacyl synthase [Hyella patelloides LEGE 07179]|uniref:Phenolphthiocerol/phthiocerol polyketide synthase subunit E n=1 Tax=Hyella patelloides LEGE 07179 TaxID=945734 RepID=A0A563W1J8_9CYAN|nr:type I polyketide synthase [Hyella patelloides]VEP17551.1 Beta-ketoacyl synthase [Hyella patelloides LEGE 07179]
MTEINTESENFNDIAIIGMAGRFPGANNLEQFWQNLVDGVESITFFAEEESAESKIDPNSLNNPNYVKAEPILEDIELFDASFFNYSHKQAEVTSPEVRLMLECAWSALENAGYASDDYPGSIGVFAGSNVSNYLAATNQSKLIPLSMRGFETYLGNDLNYLATQISYHLNLKGPSMMVQTACSTSLVAIHVANQSLLNGECDIALAGAVNLMLPQKRGYLYQEGGIFSSDGHCKAFGLDSQGTLPGSGLGIVVLKRLEDALADGDAIRAVIKSSAINNDGAVKVGYTAPSLDGQAAVVADALAIANIEPQEISYIEAHGTGTSLGDPIEIQSLTEVFRTSTSEKGFCGIGSVKSNLGHLGVAAGMPSVIKTVLALENELIPPSLHCEQTNPQIDFVNSPFYVNHQLTPWKTNGSVRRAGVSSLGVGGTNSHLIIEEAPQRQSTASSSPSTNNPYQILMLSAKTAKALERATDNLINHLKAHPELDLGDVAYSLQVGRRHFKHRRFILCQSIADAISAGKEPGTPRISTQTRKLHPPGVVMMFSGQGSQYVNMTRELYELEPYFKQQIHRCGEILQPHLDLDIRTILYPEDSQIKAAKAQLEQTAIAQPAIFVIEYALAQLWMQWGIMPQAMVGHSIGEYVAATLAGVFSLEDALALVTARGKLMQQQPHGSMLSVPLSSEQVTSYLTTDLALAVINGVDSCVVSGQTEAIANLAAELQSKGINSRLLHTSHGFHSPMMDGMIEPFKQQFSEITLHPPQIPYLSNLTGTWIKPEEATDPNYWAAHLRQTVRFSDNLQHLCQEANQILLEVGAGRTLSKLAKQHPQKQSEQLILTSVRHPQEEGSDIRFLWQTVGKLWLAGVKIDWSEFQVAQQRFRLPLPTYPFERQRYWLEPAEGDSKVVMLPTHLPQPSLEELWQPLMEAGQLQSRQGISKFDEESYIENFPSMDRVCLAYIKLTFRELGVWQDSAKSYSETELFNQAQIAPSYQQLMARWLDILVAKGHLQHTNGVYSHLAECSKDDLTEMLAEFQTRWIKFPQMIELTQQCGENLAAVIAGKKEPLEIFNGLVYQQGKNANPEMPLFAYYSAIMRASLKQLVNSLPETTQLRILEVGGGQGLATTDLLPILPVDQTKYTFTDIGNWFLTQAKSKFSDYPFLEYKLLDLANPPQDQGFESDRFDVVIAANVLHVPDNLDRTLEHIRSLLAPGGIVLIWEITTPLLFFDITSGLLMKPLTDQQRSRGNPFLTSQQWQAKLAEKGFSQVAACPDSDALGQHILIARADNKEDSSISSAFTIPIVNPAVAQRLNALSEEKKPNVTDWFYTPSWQRSPLAPVNKSQTAQNSLTYLIFADNRGFTEQITSRITNQSEDFITVKEGAEFSCQSPGQYTLNPQCKEDYQRLIRELKETGSIPSKILHCWQLNNSQTEVLNWEKTEQNQYLGFYSLLFLTQALAKENLTSELQISAISQGIQEVIGTEASDPAKATILGAIKTIPQEYSHIYCRSIDLDLVDSLSTNLIDKIITELHSPVLEPIIAYRNGRRWRETFAPLKLEAPTKENLAFKSQGVYLIVGGLGSLGLVIAEHLATNYQSKLILTGRSTFPAREDWQQWLASHSEQEPTARKIRQVQKLEDLGAEVFLASADVADAEAMKEAIDRAESRFGQLNGVIHAVATDSLEIFRPITEATEFDCQQQFQGKVKGLLVLEAILKSRQLDFCLLVSSLASFFGGVGHTAYSAANIFLDSFVQKQHQANFPWLSVNWDGRVPTSQDVVSAELTVTPPEDIEILNRVLAWSEFNRLVVSSKNLQPRIDRWQQLQIPPESLAATQSPPAKTETSYTRPELETDYVAPKTETEQKLAKIWQSAMGVERVGIYDNFFELGGDSLVGIQVIAQIRETFQIDLPMTILFETLTVVGIGEHIDSTYQISAQRQAALSHKSNEREEIEI